MPFENNYSLLDRTIHRIAFRTGAAQVAMADIEDRLFARQTAACDARRPVFVAALPRAGTTLLLELLAGLDEFASHVYRDMPFVLIPSLWNRATRRARRDDQRRERAHGDGVTINADSPEALEEVLWKTFWKRHYEKDRIVPWGDRVDRDFHEFFRNHMRKIVCTRGRGPDARYLSKNNPNIARLALLRAMFSDGTIVAPFRDPLQHAASLARQHANFLELQRKDPFALEYMTGIGHWDFGRSLRPIDFGGWLASAQHTDPSGLGYWLEYWIAAYRHLLSEASAAVHLVSYDHLCQDAVGVMGRLADLVDVSDRAALLHRAEAIHPVASRDPAAGDAQQALVDEAYELHAALLDAAL